MRAYRLGTDFPSEGFVQTVIEGHFRSLGFTIDTTSDIDLICHRSAPPERWHIEVKGKTSSCGLDFRTCLGQLVQRAPGPEVRCGLALPDIPQYRVQIAKTSPWAIDVLRLTWLIVQVDGRVEVIAPEIP